jgi:prevent-host-death family protein
MPLVLSLSKDEWFRTWLARGAGRAPSRQTLIASSSRMYDNVRRKLRSSTMPHRRLRNESGRILREAQRGHRFVVTVNGRPAAVVGPAEPDVYIPVARAREALESKGWALADKPSHAERQPG